MHGANIEELCHERPHVRGGLGKQGRFGFWALEAVRRRPPGEIARLKRGVARVQKCVELVQKQSEPVRVKQIGVVKTG